MGAGAVLTVSNSNSSPSSVSVDDTAATTSAAATPSASPVDNILWIATSLKNVLPYLKVESVLCLHNVSKLVVCHARNLGVWRIMCLRDFPNARSQFHDRVLLGNTSTTTTTPSVPDADAKQLYFELFCQRFIVQAEISLPSHPTGHVARQLNELFRHKDTPIPIDFRATVGHVPDGIPAFPALAPTETSSLTLEWIPRPGVELTDKNMDLLRRAFAFMAFFLCSDPKDGGIQVGSGTKSDAPRVVMSRGTTAEGDPVVVSSFNFQNGSEAWKRTRKGSRGAFQQVWKLFKRHVWQRRRGKKKPNNYRDAAEDILHRSRLMFALLKFLRQTRHMRRRARKRATAKRRRQTKQTKSDKAEMRSASLETKQKSGSSSRKAPRAKRGSLSLKIRVTPAILRSELTRDFFCMSRRVPVFSVGTGCELNGVMFNTLTRKDDDASLDMDVETLDRSKLRQGIMEGLELAEPSPTGYRFAIGQEHEVMRTVLRNPEPVRAVLRQLVQAGVITEAGALDDFSEGEDGSNPLQLSQSLRYYLAASNEPFRILMMLLTGMHSANFRTNKGSIYRIRFVAPGAPNSASTPVTKDPAAAASKASKTVAMSAAYPLVLVCQGFSCAWESEYDSSAQNEKLDREFRQLIEEEMRAVDALDTSDSSSVTDTNWMHASKRRTLRGGAEGGAKVAYSCMNNCENHFDYGIRSGRAWVTDNDSESKEEWPQDPVMYLQQNVPYHLYDFERLDDF